MDAPQCRLCGKVLSDWQGNVMVVSDDYFNARKINGLEVWCKSCTRKMDANRQGQRMHNLWELAWIKDSFVWVALIVLTNSADILEQIKWSKAAIRDFVNLVKLAFPNAVQGPMAIMQAISRS